MNTYQSTLLESFSFNPDDRDFIEQELNFIALVFSRCDWSQDGYLKEATEKQIEYLASLMDLEKDDRLKVLSLLVGFQVMNNKTLVPSSRDSRINRWMFAVLIDYYLGRRGKILNERLGLLSQTASRSEKRAKKDLERAEKIIGIGNPAI